MLDVQHEQVRVFHQPIELREEGFFPGKRIAGGVQTGMHTFFLGQPEQLCHKLNLEKGFPATDGNAPIISPVGFVTQRLLQDFLRRLKIITAFGPGVRVMAVFTTHIAALQKYDIAHARPVCGAKAFHGMYVSKYFAHAILLSPAVAFKLRQ